MSGRPGAPPGKRSGGPSSTPNRHTITTQGCQPGPMVPDLDDLLDRAERQIATDLGITVEQWRQRADDLATAAYFDRPSAVTAGAVTRCWRCGRFTPPDDATLRWVQTGTVDDRRPLLSVGSFCHACEQSGGAR